MSAADMDPVMRRHPGRAGPSSPTPPSATTNHSRSQAQDRPRDVAMKHARDNKGFDNDSRDRARGRNDRDRLDRDGRVSPIDSSSRTSALPPWSPSSRRPENYGNGGDSVSGRGRDNRDDRSAQNIDNPHRLDVSQRGRSRNRSRDPDTDSHEPKSRSFWDEGQDTFEQGNFDHGSVSPPRRGSRRNEYASYGGRGRSFSPGSRKRRRTRSPLPFPPSRPKKSRRERERDRRRRAERAERIERAERDQVKHQFPPPFRGRSPSPRYDDPRFSHTDRGDSFESRREYRDRSLPRGGDPDQEPLPLPRSRRNSQTQERSRSPLSESRRSSFSHTHSPRPPSRRQPGSSETGSYSRLSSPAFEHRRPDFPRSPGGRGHRRSRKKGKHRDDPRFARDHLASGANSIEVNMSRRLENRGTTNTPLPPVRSGNPPYNERRSAHSPVRPNSGSSFHESPTSRSPFGGGRGGWSGPRQGSPHRRYHSRQPSQQPQSNNHFPPTGPSGRHASSQSPPHPPTGPSQSYSQNRSFSRGGFRGSSHPARGGYRGIGGQRTSGPGRGASGESSPRHHSPYNASSHPERTGSRDEERNDDSAHRAPNDEELPSGGNANEQMPPPGPPLTAPTGPSSSKFSFAFKATNKTPVATPKPEISQKFNTASRKDTGPFFDDRGRDRDQDRERDRDRDRARDRERDRDRNRSRNQDRDLPRDTPREPASARARSEYHGGRGLPEPPRTRKVKKLQRKLKAKPELPADLAASDSVFFRKPGNESVVGSGTYGKVFKGLHVYTKKLVALKKIRMEGERDGFPVTAVREIKLLQSLKHTNIVNLQEVMVEKNDCYMVFEYLSHDLTGLLNHPSYALDPAQKKHLALQLFEGLDYLHKRGVLHRDIKAANILVSSDGVLKLADFGLARFYAKRHQVDYTNRVITIWYRSPELLLGETRYGAAVDIWSAACVLVEIFTRHAIFPGDGGEINQLEKIYAVLGTPNKADWPGLVDMPWFELLRPGYRRPNVFSDKYRERVPAAAFELLASMFQYDPVKRPSAAEVLEHPYFTTEAPPPRQALELRDIEGDWHEFESKALRREKEKKEKQERDARRAAGSKDGGSRDRDKKRPLSTHDSQRDSKRPHVDGRGPSLNRAASSNAMQANEGAENALAAE
ncbi:Pkinase-domain-containing protein [Hypoxylon sp. FL1284]|nr:Pkinase-domain-containing protein [Hypoxylon sp. FL1284]